jgi:hypothetical protein
LKGEGGVGREGKKKKKGGGWKGRVKVFRFRMFPFILVFRFN